MPSYPFPLRCRDPKCRAAQAQEPEGHQALFTTHVWCDEDGELAPHDQLSIKATYDFECSWCGNLAEQAATRSAS